MNNNVWPTRLYALDVSRGFAALSVVLSHWMHFAYEDYALPGDFVKENSQPMYELLRLFYEKGYMGVEYFFLLSGFIFFWLYRDSIKNKKIGVRLFFIQRFSRLYPLHLLTLIIVASLQLLYTSREGVAFVYEFNDLYHFILNLGFASNWGFQKGWSFNGPIWSLSIEVLLYFIFFIIAFFRKGGWLFCIIVSVGSFLLLHLVGISLFKGLTLFFLGGFVFHSAFYISTKFPFLKGPVYIATITAWLSTLTSFYVYDLSSMILGIGIFGKIILIGFPVYILFPLTVCSLALLGVDNGSFLKQASWIGDITYSSYLLHFPLNLLFGLAVSYGIINSVFYMNPISLILYFIILVPSSYVVYLKFERPMQRLIRHWTQQAQKT